ncbi:MAG: hypothetical protein ABH828_06530 [archaeon]
MGRYKGLRYDRSYRGSKTLFTLLSISALVYVLRDCGVDTSTEQELIEKMQMFYQ